MFTLGRPALQYTLRWNVSLALFQTFWNFDPHVYSPGVDEGPEKNFHSNFLSFFPPSLPFWCPKPKYQPTEQPPTQPSFCKTDALHLSSLPQHDSLDKGLQEELCESRADLMCSPFPSTIAQHWAAMWYLQIQLYSFCPTFVVIYKEQVYLTPATPQHSDTEIQGLFFKWLIIKFYWFYHLNMPWIDLFFFLSASPLGSATIVSTLT